MTLGLSLRSTLLIFEAAMTFAAISLAPSPASAASLTPLGSLPGGGFASQAWGVSGDGSVVVGLSQSDSGDQAFRWTSSGGMVGLGTLPGGTHSIAYDASSDGSVIVGSVGSSNFGSQAFRWTSSGGMVGLGHLPGGGGSTAHGVSGDGSIIVGYGDRATGVGREAVLWTSAGGMERLWDVLFANGVNPAADGWTRLAEAYGVSADGSTIVGYGIRNGNIEAFVAVVPQPSLLGDFNNDGNVDAADYVVWRKGLGITYTQNDYGVWRAHFEASLGPGSGSKLPSVEPLSAAVPEPSALLLFSFGLAAVFLRRSADGAGRRRGALIFTNERLSGLAEISGD